MSLSSQRKWTWRRILGLDPHLRVLALALLATVYYRYGILLAITQGFRNNEAQLGLWKKGRTEPGEPCRHRGRRRTVGECESHPLGLKVTNAKPGESRHQKREAFDVAILNDVGTPCWPEDDDLWEKVGAAGEALGLSWGGRWPERVRDKPHFELDEDPPETVH